MRIRFVTIWAALALMAAAVGTSAQSTSSAPAREGKDPPSDHVKVAIDPRSSGGMEAEMLTKGFRNICPNVSIIRDEPEAESLDAENNQINQSKLTTNI